MISHEKIKDIIMDCIASVIVSSIIDRIQIVTKTIIVIFDKNLSLEEILFLNELKERGYILKGFCPKGSFSNYEFHEIIYEDEVNSKNNLSLACGKSIVCGLNISSAAKISLLIEDDFYSKAVLRMIYTGVKVYSISNITSELNVSDLSDGIKKKILDIVNSLKEYGVVFLKETSGEFYKHNSKVLSREDVLRAYGMKKNILVDENTLITDSARDASRDLKIKIVKSQVI